MPSTRQFRSIGLVTVIALCVIYYIYNGASNTYDSDFYQRTKAVVDQKKSASASRDREHLVASADEQDRRSRVERLRKEHDAAVVGVGGSGVRDKDGNAAEGGKKIVMITSTTAPREAAVTEVVAGEKRIKGQKPLLKVPADKDKDKGKVVLGAPEKDSDDGVAKIGNVRKPSSQQVKIEEEVGVCVCVEGKVR
jgi:hypothetical protein